MLNTLLSNTIPFVHLYFFENQQCLFYRKPVLNAIFINKKADGIEFSISTAFLLYQLQHGVVIVFTFLQMHLLAILLTTENN